MKFLQKIPAVLWCSVVAITLMASDCSLGTPDPEPIPQTRILEIRLTPDTVAVGDTVLIHCVIEDSLDSRFEFYWGFPQDDQIPVNRTIFGDKIKWKAKSTSDDSGKVVSASTTVRVDNGSEDSTFVIGSFEIPVKNPN
jgi:hypothetical protein